MPDSENERQFNFWDRTQAAYSEIALRLDCDEAIVISVFGWLPSPFFSNPQASKIYRKENKEIGEIAGLVKKLASKTEVSENRVLRKALAHCDFDIEGLRKLADHLDLHMKVEAKYEAPVLRSSQGGKNWAAYDVARGVAQIYKELGRSIKFGHVDGEPSTNFGRHVAAAFDAFSIKADWREPARFAASNTDTKRFY